MKLICIMPGCPPPEGGRTVAALGFFDGVHIGHRRLLDRVREISAASGAVPSVFTFSDDTRSFKPGAARLTDFESKLDLFRLAGIERVYAAEFPDYSDLSPDRFVSDVLIGTMNAEVAVCGFNFRFGCRASGDSAALVSLMRAAGRGAEVIEATRLRGTVVSSSAIRDALSEGNIVFANEMLGRPYAIPGRVEHGRGYGHTEGVPTLNLSFPPEIAIPRYGVYASRVVTGNGTVLRSVSNVGVRPTFGDGAAPNCETHLIDFSGGDLYGCAVRVELVRFLRPERRFDSPDDLYRQIALDVAAARSDPAPEPRKD